MQSAKVHSAASAPASPAASSPTFPHQPLYVVAQHYWKTADRKTQVAIVAGLVAVTAGTTYLVVQYRNKRKKGAAGGSKSRRSIRAKTPSKSQKSKKGSIRSIKSSGPYLPKDKTKSKPKTPVTKTAKPYQVTMAYPPSAPTYTQPPPPPPRERKTSSKMLPPTGYDEKGTAERRSASKTSQQRSSSSTTKRPGQKK